MKREKEGKKQSTYRFLRFLIKLTQKRKVGKNKQFLRRSVIGAAVIAGLTAAFWISAPSSHSERPLLAALPETSPPATDTPAVKAIIDYETIAPSTGAAPTTENTFRTIELTVSRGDTLMKMLTDAGISRAEAHTAITALAKVFKPRDLKPGITVTVTQEKATAALQRIDLAADPRHEIAVRRDKTGRLKATAIKKALTTQTRRASGVIRSSLYLAGQRAELPPSVLARLIRIFSFDVDFQRDVQPDDSFDLMFERLYDESSTAVAEGNILIAEMVLSNKRVRLYRHRSNDGNVDYYDSKGHSVRKALILTPIDGARISSGFGRRRHPILGYNKMHRGVDFAAPRGTPIYAAGNGTVEVAGRKGAYGKYIRIRHNGRYKTAYAHLHGYARGIRRGRRVRQGEVIGYVGSTGRSTGPHLHYEILRNGHQINPKKLNLPSGRKLVGAELKRFMITRDALEQRHMALASVAKVAGSCGIC